MCYVLLFNEARSKSILHFTKKHMNFEIVFSPSEISQESCPNTALLPSGLVFFLIENSIINTVKK